MNTLDGSLCDSILFAEFSNLTGKHCTAVCQFRWSIFPAHLFNDFGPLRGKGFHLLGQALAVVLDCLQGWELVFLYKGVFRKYLVDVPPDGFQLRAVDARLLFLGQDAQLITVVQIQAVHLGFSKEYLKENLKDAFSFIGILGAIPFRRVLLERMFQLIQP